MKKYYRPNSEIGTRFSPFPPGNESFTIKEVIDFGEFGIVVDGMIASGGLADSTREALRLHHHEIKPSFK